MNKPEQKLWQMVKKQLPGEVSRVENIADSGDPDVSGACDGDYWVELKVSQNLYKFTPVEKLLRPSQFAWHARRVKHGTLIFVLTHYPKMLGGVLRLQRCIAPEVYEDLLIMKKQSNKFAWSMLVDTIKNEINKKNFDNYKKIAYISN